MHDSIFEASNEWFHAVNLIMRILTEGANAANLPSPKSLQEYLEYDEKTRRQILFYVPFLIVLSTDGKFDFIKMFDYLIKILCLKFKILQADQTIKIQVYQIKPR